jgi:hypothetical protein
VARPARIRIETTKAWEAILSPVRREIVDSMQKLGPCSIADVARDTGRPADGLYRHVAVLVKSGFLKDAGTRTGRRNAERLYDAAANEFLAPRVRRDATGAEREAIVRTAEALAKSSVRALRGSAASGRIHCEADSRNFTLIHVTSWLTPTRFEELRALVFRMNALLERGRRDRTGDPYEVFALATPVTRRPGPDAPARTGARRKKKAR